MYSLEEKISILFGEYGVTAKKFYNLFNIFGSANELFANFANNAAVRELIGENYAKICSALKGNVVETIIKKMLANGIIAVTCFSPDFPEKLRVIDDPPYILFCKGNVKLLNTESLSVVGTRKVSSYGRRIAKDFTAILCEYFTIVSGLAYGVDSIAHETTLEYNGATIAVLGGGLLNVYPASNKGLAEKIISNNGLIVSEYGLNAIPMTYHFPQRNRIVSGLSRGVLVCQAPLKSGTSSTIELALDQGRDVFVVPGEIYDLGFSGSNNIIKSMQGACVTTPRDIVSYYHLDSDSSTKKESYQLSIEEQKIVNALSVDAKTFDELVETTKLLPSELYFLLANLELKSIIARLPGNCYRLYGGIE